MAYASWGKRALAYIVDLLIIAPLYVIYLVVGTDTVEVDPQTLAVTGGTNFFGYILYLVILAVWGYNRWFQAGATGQSWGRKAIGVKVVSEESGAPIGVANSFIRDLAHILDSVACLVGWLFPLWDAKKQTFADKIMKTASIDA